MNLFGPAPVAAAPPTSASASATGAGQVEYRTVTVTATVTTTVNTCASPTATIAKRHHNGRFDGRKYPLPRQMGRD